jgi:hypothetical protein
MKSVTRYFTQSCSVIAAQMFFLAPSFAETANTQNLTLSPPCIGCRTSFTVSQSNGPAGSGDGLAMNTFSGLFEWTLGNGPTGRLAPFANATRYGLFFDNTHIFQSFLTPTFFTIVSTNTTTCPTANQAYNFILIRGRPPTDLRFPMDATSASFFAGGSVTYDHTERTIQGEQGFSLASPTPSALDSWYEGLGGEGPSGSVGSIASACASGRHLLRSYDSQSPFDSFSTVFYGDEGFLGIGLGGNPTVVLGSEVSTLDGTRMNQIAGTVMSGFFNAYIGVPTRTTTVQKNIYVYPNANSTSFVLREMSALNDPWSYSNYGTLDCPSGNWNSPLNGFVRCTLTLTAVGGSGNAVCMVSKRGSQDLLACNAQHPSNNEVTATLLAVTHGRSLLALELPSPALELPSPGQADIVVTVKNVTGVPISPSIGLPDAGLRLNSPYSIITPIAGAEPNLTFAGTAGVCGNTLGAYQSCTITVRVNPGSFGTFTDTLRVQYHSGESVQNATANLITTVGLTGLEITPPGPFNAENTQQLTVTATYSNLATQNVSGVAAWSSSNSLISVNSAGLATFFWEPTGTTVITASLGSVQTNISPTVNNPGPRPVLAILNVMDLAPSAHRFTVTYSDPNGIDVSTLGNNDVRITGPSGYDALATYVGVNIGSNGTPRTATYQIAGPGGDFGSNDVGTYSVLAEAGSVADAIGGPIAASSLGSFQRAPLSTIRLGRTQGDITNVTINGNYAYTITTTGMDVYDISAPANPIFDGFTAIANASDVAISGTNAYVTAGTSLISYDITDPINPVLLQTFSISGATTLYGVEVSGSYAYVAAGTARMKVIDISNPSSMSLAATSSTTGDMRGVVISGGYAYVACFTKGLHIYNISTPSSPTLSYEDNSAGGEGVAISGVHVYVARQTTSSLIYDVTNPLAPTKPGTLVTASAVGFGDGHLWLGRGATGASGYALTNPAAPTLVTTQNTLGTARTCAGYGTLVYCADLDRGLAMIRRQPGYTIINYSRWLIPAESIDISVSGNYAFIADDNTSGVAIIDISNPLKPRRTSQFRIGEAFNYAKAIHAVGNYCYVAYHNAGLVILDISDINNPIKVGELITPVQDHTVGTHVLGNYAYTANLQYSGLTVIGAALSIIDVSNPAAPTLTSKFTHASLTEPRRVHVVGNYAYIADLNRLIIVNVTNKAAPTFVGSLDTDGTVEDIQVQGNYAYIADGARNFKVINISIPTAPTLAASFDTAGTARGIFVSGDLAYVANAGSGIFVYNISNPNAPVYLGLFDTQDAYDLAVANGYMFIADMGHGLKVGLAP